MLSIKKKTKKNFALDSKIYVNIVTSLDVWLITNWRLINKFEIKNIHRFVILGPPLS